MTNFEKYFPGRKIDEFKGMTGLATNNKIRDCDHCPAEKMCCRQARPHLLGNFCEVGENKVQEYR